MKVLRRHKSFQDSQGFEKLILIARHITRVTEDKFPILVINSHKRDQVGSESSLEIAVGVEEKLHPVPAAT